MPTFSSQTDVQWCAAPKMASNDLHLLVFMLLYCLLQQWIIAGKHDQYNTVEVIVHDFQGLIIKGISVSTKLCLSAHLRESQPPCCEDTQAASHAGEPGQVRLQMTADLCDIWLQPHGTPSHSQTHDPQKLKKMNDYCQFKPRSFELTS